MPLYWTIDSKERFFTGVGEGEVTLRDAMSLLEALVGAGALSYRKLFDGRAVRASIKHFRRIATRFDKLASNFLAAVALASARLWIRSYESNLGGASPYQLLSRRSCGVFLC
jgi:hypothetical protein